MKTKHTPGPWSVRRKYGEKWLDQGFAIRHKDATTDGGEFCEVVVMGPALEAMTQAEANARLISASPDLLEAAVELRDAFLAGCGDATKGPKRKRLVKAAEKLDAAIAKAKGGAV